MDPLTAIAAGAEVLNLITQTMQQLSAGTITPAQALATFTAASQGAQSAMDAFDAAGKPAA